MGLADSRSDAQGGEIWCSGDGLPVTTRDHVQCE